MMLLLITIGKERYGIDASHVVKVIPPVAAKSVPATPDYICGLLNFHGDPITVVDINYLYTQKPASICLGSRIIIVDLAHSQEVKTKDPALLGILAERVTEAIHVDESELTDSAINMDDKSFLKKVVMHGKEIIQLINLDKLIPEKWRSKVIEADTLLTDDL